MRSRWVHVRRARDRSVSARARGPRRPVRRAARRARIADACRPARRSSPRERPTVVRVACVGPHTIGVAVDTEQPMAAGTAVCQALSPAQLATCALQSLPSTAEPLRHEATPSTANVAAWRRRHRRQDAAAPAACQRTRAGRAGARPSAWSLGCAFLDAWTAGLTVSHVTRLLGRSGQRQGVVESPRRVPNVSVV